VVTSVSGQISIGPRTVRFQSNARMRWAISPWPMMRAAEAAAGFARGGLCDFRGCEYIDECPRDGARRATRTVAKGDRCFNEVSGIVEFVGERQRRGWVEVADGLGRPPLRTIEIANTR
jgi:hypothetical protein